MGTLTATGLMLGRMRPGPPNCGSGLQWRDDLLDGHIRKRSRGVSSEENLDHLHLHLFPPVKVKKDSDRRMDGCPPG